MDYSYLVFATIWGKLFFGDWPSYSNIFGMFLIAFSGGQDSLFLIILMLQFIHQFNSYFGLIYCNHLWHLSNLYKLSHLLKIDFIINKSLFFSITSKKYFTEKKARIWRYSITYRVSQFYNYPVIFTGHTLTDQAETLLLNLFRSSSKDGVTSLFLKQFITNKILKNVFLSKQKLNTKIKNEFNDLYLLS